MTAQRKPAEPTGAFRQVAKGGAVLRRMREDREDRAALDEARDAMDAGTLETISNAELKARLGLS
ncbi:MAG: hypothetical protein KA744_04860 [Phenylobacterium sp.]|nr:hypothetical protein [Phenylobacterium sp.]MBP9756960.1 hypothetical protein [Phenylobacterium sp.]